MDDLSKKLFIEAARAITGDPRMQVKFWPSDILTPEKRLYGYFTTGMKGTEPLIALDEKRSETDIWETFCHELGHAGQTCNYVPKKPMSYGIKKFGKAQVEAGIRKHVKQMEDEAEAFAAYLVAETSKTPIIMFKLMRLVEIGKRIHEN